MTIHLSPLHHADDDRSQHSAGPGFFAHGFVALAMALVAAAVAAYLGLDRGLDPVLAAAAGFGVLAVAVAVHMLVSRGPADRARAPVARPRAKARRRKAAPVAEAAVQSEAPAAACPITEANDILAGPVAPPPAEPEPAGLAMALLARALEPARPPGAAAAAPAFETVDEWTRSLPATEPPAMPSAPGHVLSSLNLSAGNDARFDTGRGFDAGQSIAPPELPPVPPVLAAPAAMVSPQVETEFERVDRLVRRLADHVNQLNAGHAAPAVAPPDDQLPLFPDGDHASRQIAASISALRRSNDAEHAAATAAPEPLAPVLPAVEPANMVPSPPASVVAAASAQVAAPPAMWAEPMPVRAHNPAAEAMRAGILSAINAQRIDVYLEPILDLAGQRPQHYEVSIGLRTANGAMINLAQAANDLSGTGLLPLIDSARIARAVQMARRLAERGKEGSVFARLSGETLDDDGFQDTFAHIRIGAFPGQMVLTLPQSHVRMFTDADWHTLARLRAAGFSFALSDVTSLDMDFGGLADSGFTFARLDAEAFLIGLPMGEGHVPPPDICRHLSHAGLALIVGGILDDAQMARIFGFGVLFGQGQLFGGPRPVKAGAPAQSSVAAE